MLKYTFSSNALFALMGLYSGKLVPLPQFPKEIPVQIILDRTGTIRAMRNQLEQLNFVPGIKLKNWGHLATLSPQEEHYTLFDLWQGLFLCDLKKEKKPVFLSTQPSCAWNNKGTKIAYADEHYLGVYDIPKNIKKTYPFPPNNLGMIRVVFSIAWSPQDDKLLYAFLEDYPQQGSNLFQITIIDKQGKELGTKLLQHLGPLCWLSDEEILLVANPSSQKTGEIIIWNYQTNKSTILFDNLTGACNNLCFNQSSSSLAYTLSRDETGEKELYLYTLTQSKPTKIKSLIFPIHNLQWTKDNTLIFWEEINNSINIIKKTGEEITKFKGFLPPKSVEHRFLYFPEEPKEEPLPLFLSP
ncbi:MAG: WD40 repeat domain-containing protein [Clostridia bacterium]|nr:WD40 repeat domain-containing protein [Clostridia bacterium]